jgi:hypothetical protein
MMGGDRYRSLNRVRAEIVEGGVKVWSSNENTPYVQLKQYNTTLGGQPREYAPLPSAIAASVGVRKMIAHHLHAALGGGNEVLGQRPPLASSFQTMTMAIHRARPIMIKPARYSG